jgi:hypothetical protein
MTMASARVVQIYIVVVFMGEGVKVANRDFT